MKIFVINAGSSSLKFQLLDMPSGQHLYRGIAERIGTEQVYIRIQGRADQWEKNLGKATHGQCLQEIVNMLMAPEKGTPLNPDEIAAVGHRVVHGGRKYSEATEIDEGVKQEIDRLSVWAPLHNPVNLACIREAELLFRRSRQMAVFDTAFHHSMPVYARKYAIPNDFYERYGIQGYGFHGINHQYIAEQATSYLNRKNPKIIGIHLGNGCSMTAVKDGKSVDHSMGFSPSSGLIMGTRSGDIDHSIIFHLTANLGYTLQEARTLLDTQSGMLGLTGYSDLRDIQAEAEKGNKACQLALEMNAYRIKKYIGAYSAILDGLDAVVFSGGIGENSALLRKMVCQHLEFLGIHLDFIKNEVRENTVRELHQKRSKVKILVIPANEELAIARQLFDKLSVR